MESINRQLRITDDPLAQGHVVVHHSKTGINAFNLKELIGFGSYDTTWTGLQKLRRCTIRQEREKLSGRFKLDEFVVGGQGTGKRGRGDEKKSAQLLLQNETSKTKSAHSTSRCTGLQWVFVRNLHPRKYRTKCNDCHRLMAWLWHH
jgi:hypothetical protein